MIRFPLYFLFALLGPDVGLDPLSKLNLDVY